MVVTVDEFLSKLTYHAVYDESVLAALSFAKKSGFAGIQLAVETPHLSFESLSRKDVEEIASFRKDNELLISIHAPDSLTSFFTTSPSLLEGIFDYLKRLLDFARAIGAHIVTLHPGAPVVYRTDDANLQSYPREDEEFYRHALRRNLDRLCELEVIKEKATTIAFETYQMTPILFEVLEDHLQQGTFSLCWDVAKTWSKKEVEEYLWPRLDHVAQVHLHDVGKGRSHLILGNGEIDFLPYLERFGQSEVAEYCIEVRPKEAAVESRENLIEMLS